MPDRAFGEIEAGSYLLKSGIWNNNFFEVNVSNLQFFISLW
jgi:hypothetical protein